MENLEFATGMVEMSVNGGRTVRFNPSDLGFVETLYNLIAKVDAIHAEFGQKKDKIADDPARFFDLSRNSDKRMREAVDSVFGEGFCDDVFSGIRLVAMADGLTVLENFIFALIDRMDDSVKDNMSKRQGRVEKYTSRYQRYTGK